MRINIDGNPIEGTAQEIMEYLRQKAWDADEDTTAEEFIVKMQATYRRMCEKDMEIPDGTTEEKSRAVLKALAEIRLITIEEESENEK